MEGATVVLAVDCNPQSLSTYSKMNPRVFVHRFTLGGHVQVRASVPRLGRWRVVVPRARAYARHRRIDSSLAPSVSPSFPLFERVGRSFVHRTTTPSGRRA